MTKWILTNVIHQNGTNGERTIGCDLSTSISGTKRRWRRSGTGAVAPTSATRCRSHRRRTAEVNAGGGFVAVSSGVGEWRFCGPTSAAWWSACAVKFNSTASNLSNHHSDPARRSLRACYQSERAHSIPLKETVQWISPANAQHLIPLQTDSLACTFFHQTQLASTWFNRNFTFRFNWFESVAIQFSDSVELIREWRATSAALQAIYTTASVTLDDGRRYEGESQVAALVAQSPDTATRLRAWSGWRHAVGPPSRHLYARLVRLANAAAANAGTRPPPNPLESTIIH